MLNLKKSHKRMNRLKKSRVKINESFEKSHKKKNH